MNNGMESQEEFDYLFKVLLVGETGVGKSCLLLRYADNFFSQTYISTIDVDIKIKKLCLNDKTLKLQIWDTAGQERYRTIVASFYRGAHGILLVFDVTDQRSFVNCKHWLSEMKKNTSEGAIAILLVGNKSDQESKRVVDAGEAAAFAKQHGLKYMETSAKESIGVDDAFRELCGECIHIAINKTINEQKVKNVEQTLNDPKPQQVAGCTC